MRPRSTDKTVESLKIFPYVAWGLVILFGFFVYRLTTTLDATASELDEKSSQLETKVQGSLEELKRANFEQ